MDCPSFCHWIFSPKGEILGYYGRAFKPQMQSSSSPFGRGNLRIPREDMRRMLLEELNPGTVQWSKKLLSVSEAEDKVKLLFDDSTHAFADVVIGADGIKSLVKKYQNDYIAHCSGSKKRKRNSLPHGSASGPHETNGHAKKSSILHPDLSYLGVAVILGISTAVHPLLHEKGFYVIDGVNRLFTMPFRAEGCPPFTWKSDVKGKENIASLDTPSFHNGHEESQVREGACEGAPPQTMWQLSFSDCSEEEASALKNSSSEEIIAFALNKTKDWFPPVADLITRTLAGEVRQGLVSSHELLHTLEF